MLTPRWSKWRDRRVIDMAARGVPMKVARFTASREARVRSDIAKREGLTVALEAASSWKLEGRRYRFELMRSDGDILIMERH